MPTCRSIGKGLYEVHSSFPSGKIARVLFCIYEEKMILLHGFIKKTPTQDLDLALKRKKTLEVKKMTNNPYVGSSLDDLLEENGVLAEINAVALKRVLAWQVLQEMKKRGLSKSQMAVAMNTSRPSLDRLLDPNNISVTMKTMERAAAILGKRLRIELVDIQEGETELAS
jgi:antitoxin HicB